MIRTRPRSIRCAHCAAPITCGFAVEPVPNVGDEAIPDLAPTGVLECATQHTVTQADLDAGSLTSSATATGTGPFGRVTAASNVVSVPAVQRPELTTVKTAAGAGFGAVGDTLSYRIAVTNTGNVTTIDVVVSDPNADPGSVVCTGGSDIGGEADVPDLEPGAVLDCTATHTVTQADLDAGGVANTATATSAGTKRDGVPVTDPSDEVVVALVERPGLAVATVVDPAGPVSVGDTLTYTATLTNSGNVPLSDVTLTAPLPGLSAWRCDPAQPAALAVGAVMICTATYTVTADDAANGSVSSRATAAGTSPAGAVVESSADTAVAVESGQGQATEDLPGTGAGHSPTLALLGVLLLGLGLWVTRVFGARRA